MNIIPINIQRFASGEFELGTHNTGSYNVYLQGKIVWSSTSNGSTANTSNVSADLYVKKVNTSYSTTGKDWSGYITIDGETSSFSTISSSITVGQDYVKVWSYSKTVQHESSGSKVITIGARIKGPTGTSIASLYSEGSSSCTLDTIPRADSIGNQSATIGTQTTFSWSTNSSSFTHNLRANINGTENTIGTSLGTSWTGTFDYGWANSITNGSSANGTLYLDTYSSGNYIGTSTATITLAVPNNDTTKPTLTTTIAETNSTMKTLNWGLYLKGVSQLLVTLTASAKYGASISSYSTTYADSSSPYTTNPATTNPLYNSGSVVSYATDSRGFTSSSVSKAYTVVDYSAPSITFSVDRDTSDTTKAVVKYTSSVYYISGKNSKTLTLKYKKKSESDYTSVDLTSNYALNSAKTLYTVDTSTDITVENDYQYDFQLVVSDSIYSSTLTAEIGTSFSLMDFNSDGTGIAFGKASEQSNTFEVALDAEFTGKLNKRKYQVITTSTDLNTIKTSGLYGIRFSPTSYNAPVANWGTLMVEDTTTSGTMYQIYIPDTSNILYKRFYTGRSWTSWQSICSLSAYPVGSIYMSVNSTSPASLFGGTWEQVSKGRFLIGAGSPTANTDDTSFGVLNDDGYVFYSGNQGGQYKHTLTTDEMPSHQHAQGSNYGYITSMGYIDSNYAYQYGGAYSDRALAATNDTSYAYGTLATGGGQTHNNMPPYLVVYIWKRTA